METKANYVAVGAFVLASVLGFVVALLWLAGAQYSAEYAYYRTYFSGAVTGLGDGTIVRYNGINVGHVSKLTFDPNDPKRVIVDLQVDPTLKIHNDSIASIASEGLTGGSYVEIDGGSKNKPVLERKMFGDYPVIQSKQSTLQQLEQSAPELIAKLNHAADRLNRVLSDQNIKNFSGILSNIKSTTDVLTARKGDIDNTLHNVSLASNKLTTDLDDLHVTLTNANGALTKVSRLADDADSAVNGADLGQLSEQVRTLASSLTKLSNGLEREPTKLLFGDRRKGYTPQ
ncbi:MAG TPA: MlaD family protein [Rhizomicrobium sp.]|jgi:phospholipid/cholesterol/gamma-HCH transport system substrate-binding protein|nr:MlaD family protein [Rhizomicrobium sp.]